MSIAFLHSVSLTRAPQDDGDQTVVLSTVVSKTIHTPSISVAFLHRGTVVPGGVSAVQFTRVAVAPLTTNHGVAFLSAVWLHTA